MIDWHAALYPGAVVPPHFAAMLVGVAAMVIGSLAPQSLIKPTHGRAHHLDLGHPAPASAERGD